MLDVNNSGKERPGCTTASLHFTLYVKDTFSISNQAYHELSILPASNQVKKLASTLNSNFEISSTPNGIVGVQQSLWKCLAFHLSHLVKQYQAMKKQLPSPIKVKLTGDGTQIARGFSVVNFAFTILEEGQNACSAKGNHTIAILKVSENYDDLAAGLEDILK